MDYTSLLMFPALFLLIFLGIPIAFSLFSVALVFGLFTFDMAAFHQFTSKVEGVATNFVLAAVPLFVFMGAMMERSGIAERLFEAVHLWTRRLPGGLAIGTIIMCVIFAASTGVIGATETVVGLLAIPAMLKHSYDKGLISGTICAGGSLGTIIPPSVVVVVLGPIADVSIGDLFIGMLFPGLILSGLYILYIVGLCLARPQAAPRIDDGKPEVALVEKIIISLKALVPPILLIFAVLGSIMFGWAAPTEAAGLGAIGSAILAAGYGRFTLGMLGEALVKTLTVTCMIMLILLAGSMFTGVFVGSGGIAVVHNLLEATNLGPWGLIFLFLGLIFIAGFFLEWISILLIFVPVFIPFVDLSGFDRVWFCMLVLIMVQTSYITPPMAPSIFYLRGIAPPEIRLVHMYRGIAPFLVAQFICLALVMAFPQLALWLPEKMLGF